MAGSALSILLLVLFISHAKVQSDEGFISVDVSNKGLNFVKDLLIETAESSLVPLELPQIEKTVKIPVVGKVYIALSNITINGINVTSSTVKPGSTGIVIAVSGATASLSMNWRYSYSTWLIPIAVSDKGEASIQVEGMDVGLTVSLKNQGGSLVLSLLECGCYVKDVSIKLDGGASWLYQGIIDAFEDKIGSAVEDAISKKIKDGIVKLDSSLQSLPKEFPVTSIAALNTTFVDDPVLGDSYVDLEINGLFNANGIVPAKLFLENFQASVPCKEQDKMVTISLHENVLESASSVYFGANKMHWVIDKDKVPDQSLLNTAGWRLIVPQLYKQYPNDDMSISISLSSPPSLKIVQQRIDVAIPSDVIVNVMEADEVISVVCISVVISASASPRISRNVVVGSVKLDDFNMSLKWSKIGNLHMHLLQTTLSTLLKTVALPYVNLQLQRGYQLPVFHGYKLQNPQLQCSDSWILICSDVTSSAMYLN